MPKGDSVVIQIAKLIDTDDEKAAALPYEVRRTFSHFVGAVTDMAAEAEVVDETGEDAESNEEVATE